MPLVNGHGGSKARIIESNGLVRLRGRRGRFVSAAGPIAGDMWLLRPTHLEMRSARCYK